MSRSTVMLTLALLGSANMYVDAATIKSFVPVASGDPLSDRVILHSALNVEPRSLQDTQRYSVKVSIAESESQLFRGGSKTSTVTTTGDIDFTVKLDATGLKPSTRYVYQFEANGIRSEVGQTQTAPAPNADVESFKAAMVSCSSIYSGFMHGYKEIAQDEEIDLVIHAGDYLYDFVDGDEVVNTPEDEEDSSTVDTLLRQVNRYRLYRNDENLREAHRVKPFIILPDNHDVFSRGEFTLEQAADAFFYWTPTREPAGRAKGKHQYYRHLRWGNLADIIPIDVQLAKNQEGENDGTYLGSKQWEFLETTLARPDAAQYRIFTTQKPMSQLRFVNLPAVLYTNGGEQIARPVGDAAVFYGGWDENSEDRERFYGTLRANGLDNNIVHTGDAHLNALWELTEYPQVSGAYNPATGAGSLGFEFLASSVSRGGADETLRGALYATQACTGTLGENCRNDPQVVLAADIGSIAIEQAIPIANPNNKYFQWRDHGYGTVTLTKDAASAEVIHTNIYDKDNSAARVGATFEMVSGTNQLVRTDLGVDPPSPEPSMLARHVLGEQAAKDALAGLTNVNNNNNNNVNTANANANANTCDSAAGEGAGLNAKQTAAVVGMTLGGVAVVAAVAMGAKAAVARKRRSSMEFANAVGHVGKQAAE